MRVTERLGEGRRPEPGETYPVTGLEGGKELGEVIRTERRGEDVYVVVDVDPELTEKANMPVFTEAPATDWGTTQDILRSLESVKASYAQRIGESGPTAGEMLTTLLAEAPEPRVWAFDPPKLSVPRGGIKFDYGTPPSPEPTMTVEEIDEDVHEFELTTDGDLVKIKIPPSNELSEADRAAVAQFVDDTQSGFFSAQSALERFAAACRPVADAILGLQAKRSESV